MHIRQFSVTNFRSLKNVKVGDLSKVVVFYGENNSGKSNLLSFLETVFCRKKVEETLSLSESESTVPQQSEDFWKGEIENFSDNYYQNVNDPIKFSVHIECKLNEIKSLGEINREFLDQLVSQKGNNHLVISGRIESISSSSSKMILDDVKLNNKSFYETKSDLPVYLNGFSPSDPAVALDIFQTIMASLNDAFLRISPERFVSLEREMARGVSIPLEHGTFKNWLFQINMNSETEAIFLNILKSFQDPPFDHGRISLARVNPDLIDIYVEEHDLKLPIHRKGSGVQQILMILSFVTMTKARFLGIEEPEINLSPKSQMAIFDNLKGLVTADNRIVGQVMMTTHSPRIANRNEASRRGVWMEDGVTKVKKPTEAAVNNFFTQRY